MNEYEYKQNRKYYEKKRFSFLEWDWDACDSKTK